MRRSPGPHAWLGSVVPSSQAFPTPCGTMACAASIAGVFEKHTVPLNSRETCASLALITWARPPLVWTRPSYRTSNSPQAAARRRPREGLRLWRRTPSLYVPRGTTTLHAPVGVPLPWIARSSDALRRRRRGLLPSRQTPSRFRTALFFWGRRPTRVLTTNAAQVFPKRHFNRDGSPNQTSLNKSRKPPTTDRRTATTMTSRAIHQCTYPISSNKAR